jgi:hypothetical protein
LLATSTGVMVFLLLMLVAVQVVYQLYAASMVTAAAFDGARLAAGADLADEPARGATVAKERVVDLLGTYGRDRIETLDVHRDGDVIALHIVTKNPGFLPTALRQPMGLDEIDRTVRVRVEQVIAP